MAAVAGLWQAAQPWLLLAALAAVAFLVGLAVDRLALVTLRRAAGRTATRLDDVILAAVHPGIGLLLGVLAFHAGLVVLAGRLPARFLGWWQQLVLAVGILLVAVLAARLAAALLRHTATGKPRFVSVARVGSRVLSVAVYVIAFLVILDTYGISITPLVTSLGIAGLAVALALQDTLSNFFAGIWMQTGRALQPGHFVRLEEHKLDGFVEEVGWRTTKIRQLANNVVVVPNSKLAQAIVIDYNLPDPRTGTNLAFTVPFGTDLEKVQSILVEEVLASGAAVGGLVTEPPPTAFVRDVTESGIQVMVGFQAQEFTAQFGIQNEGRRRVLLRFAKEGIELARPVRDVRIMGAPAAAGDAASGPNG